MFCSGIWYCCFHCAALAGEPVTMPASLHSLGQLTGAVLAQAHQRHAQRLGSYLPGGSCTGAFQRQQRPT
jgi:hypothetical protein